MSETSENLLEVEGLFKEFPIRGTQSVVHACDNVSLSLRRHETLAVIGESGSGKTTLGRSLLRLVEPTAGSIRFCDQQITKLDPRAMNRLRSDMQIVFQEPFDSLNPQLSVGRQIADPLRIHTRLDRRQRVERVLELLSMVGLPPSTFDVLPGTLPPGALQRASIARAIATDPKFVVLDEPTSALAPEAEADVIQLLQKLQDELGLAFVFISHDLSLVQAISDRVLVMYLGEVVEEAPTAALFDEPLHPYTGALLASVLSPDPEHRRTKEGATVRLSGEIPSPIDRPSGCFLASRCPFVRNRCREARPTLEEVAPGRFTRCWRVSESDLQDPERSRLQKTALAISEHTATPHP